MGKVWVGANEPGRTITSGSVSGRVGGKPQREDKGPLGSVLSRVEGHDTGDNAGFRGAQSPGDYLGVENHGS